MANTSKFPKLLSQILTYFTYIHGSWRNIEWCIAILFDNIGPPIEISLQFVPKINLVHGTSLSVAQGIH